MPSPFIRLPPRLPAPSTRDAALDALLLDAYATGSDEVAASSDELQATTEAIPRAVVAVRTTGRT